MAPLAVDARDKLFVVSWCGTHLSFKSVSKTKTILVFGCSIVTSQPAINYQAISIRVVVVYIIAILYYKWAINLGLNDTWVDLISPWQRKLVMQKK